MTTPYLIIETQVSIEAIEAIDGVGAAVRLGGTVAVLFYDWDDEHAIRLEIKRLEQEQDQPGEEKP